MREEGHRGWRGRGLGSLAGPRSSLWMGVGSVAAGGPIWWEWGSWPGALGSSATACPPPLPPWSLEPCLPCGLTPRELTGWRGLQPCSISPDGPGQCPSLGYAMPPLEGHFCNQDPPEASEEDKRRGGLSREVDPQLGPMEVGPVLPRLETRLQGVCFPAPLFLSCFRQSLRAESLPGPLSAGPGICRG